MRSPHCPRRVKKLVSLFGWIPALLSPCSAGTSGPVWTNISSGLCGVVPAVNQLVIDPVTGICVYALTSTGGIFKSADRGASWTALGNIAGVNVVALDAAASSTVYAGTAHGVVTSTDGGGSWVSAGLSETNVVTLAVDPVTPSTLYAGGNGHVYKSTDGGGSWTDLNLSPLPGGGSEVSVYIAAIVLDPLTPSTLYVAAGRDLSGSFLKSLDGREQAGM